MELKAYKDYLIFGGSVVLFLISLGFFVYICINWNNPVSKDASSLEISLPVIQWERYNNLSKKLEDDKIQNNK